jgi:hypothetical protein
MITLVAWLVMPIGICIWRDLLWAEITWVILLLITPEYKDSNKDNKTGESK